MKKLIFSLLALFLLVGCDKEEQQLQKVNKDAPVFTSSFEDYDLDEKTKTYVDDKYKLQWHAADEISIFTTTLNQKYVFDGNTGDNSGSFTKVQEDKFVTGDNINRNYAVYPYSSAIRLNSSEEIIATLPATQDYAVNSFGKGANTMVAATSGLNDYFLPFKNVGGYLVIKLYGEDVTVKSIVLTGNNGEKLAGEATITAKYDEEPVAEMKESSTELITIDCGTEGVKLSTSQENPTQFWFVIPPTTFDEGFTVTITDMDGGTMTKSSSRSLIIARNIINSMSAIAVATSSVPSDQIWYTTVDGEIIEIADNEEYGAYVTSNVYEYGKGVITFSGPVKAIANGTFDNCSTLSSITIPQSVVEVNEYAFRNCTNLKSVKIGEQDAVVVHNTRASNNVKISNTQSIVSFIGKGAFSGCSNLLNVDLPKAITSIESAAFSGCLSLFSIKIPVGVTSIGAEAFSDCSSIASITIPKNVESVGSGIFSGCTGLTDVYYMPETPPSSESSIFDSGASNITIHVPEASYEAYLEDPLFDGFEDDIVGDADKPRSNEIWYTSSDGAVIEPNITDGFGVNIKSNIYEDGIGVITFDGDVVKIGRGAFDRCSTLSEAIIPNGVKIIADRAFAQTNLKSFNIPESVDSIGVNPFTRSYNLKLTGKYVSVDGISLIKDGVLISFCPGVTEPMVYNIPDGVTSIGTIAFTNYTNVTSITIPEGVVTIELGAFQSCENMTSISIPSSLKTMGYYAFSNCSSLTSIYIPKSVTYIDDGVFNKCSKLQTVNIEGGGNIEFVDNPFYGCHNIKFTGALASSDGKCLIQNGELIAFSPGTESTEAINYVLPDDITAIGNYAFAKVTSLESIIIPENVTKVKDRAFYNCTNLSKVTVLSVQPPQLEGSVFTNCSKEKTLYVKSASLESYRNSDWNNLFTEIKALGTTIGGGTTSYDEKEEIW